METLSFHFYQFMTISWLDSIFDVGCTVFELTPNEEDYSRWGRSTLLDCAGGVALIRVRTGDGRRGDMGEGMVRGGPILIMAAFPLSQD